MFSLSSLLIDFSRPYDGLGRVREASAGEVRRRIRLLPRDIVDDGIAFQFQGNADRIDVVESPAYPDAPIVLQDSFAGFQPFSVEGKLFLWRHGLIPVSLVHGDLFPRMAGNSATGKEIGRICEDDVDGLL